MCARQGALKYTLGDTTTNSIMHNNQQYDARTRPHVMHTQGHTNTNSIMHTKATQSTVQERSNDKKTKSTINAQSCCQLVKIHQLTTRHIPDQQDAHTRLRMIQLNSQTTHNRTKTQHATELTHNIQQN